MTFIRELSQTLMSVVPGLSIRKGRELAVQYLLEGYVIRACAVRTGEQECLPAYPYWRSYPDTRLEPFVPER